MPGLLSYSYEDLKTGAIKLREDGTFRPSWMGAQRITLGAENVWVRNFSAPSPFFDLDPKTPGGHDIEKLEHFLEKAQTYEDILNFVPVIYDGAADIVSLATGTWANGFSWNSFSAYWIGDYGHGAWPTAPLDPGYGYEAYFFVPAVNGMLTIIWQYDMDRKCQVMQVTLELKNS